jgi:hypothetical protein
METRDTLTVSSRQEWRDWLAAHHRDTSEVWLVLSKSPTARGGITLGQAQEEAVCFGWMDSAVKPVDESTYRMQFMPRPPHSRCPPSRVLCEGRSNRARALKMLRLGKMPPAGMEYLPLEVLRMWGEEKPLRTEP